MRCKVVSMVPSRRWLLTAIAASLAAPATSLGAGRPAAAASPAISARVRLPGGAWKLFSCSFPEGHPVGRGAALACVRERNGVGADDVADLRIG